MPVLPIYTYGTDMLRKKARPVQRVTDEVVRLIMDMFETMHKANGIGLAATQVGNLQRVVVVDLSDVEGTEDIKPMALINPEVMNREGEWTMEEGCLSIPDVRDEVKRPERVTVRFKDAQFQGVEVELAGLLARVVLHEIDHLDGVLFLDYLSLSGRKAHKEQLKKIQRGELEVTYPVITAEKVSV